MTVRIASLVPSATELLVALGLAPWLVARTGFCPWICSSR
jgi:ABC-type Fe3+-hydroxamate transport system substrate-binding protein